MAETRQRVRACREETVMARPPRIAVGNIVVSSQKSSDEPSSEMPDALDVAFRSDLRSATDGEPGWAIRPIFRITQANNNLSPYSAAVGACVQRFDRRRFAAGAAAK